MQDNNKKNKDIDKLSGIETTGHEWDGLKELNNPLPRWWLWVFYASCIWSFWYFVVYPSWPVPGGATKGTSGYTQYKELAESQSDIFARQKVYLERFEGASFEEVMADEELYAFANAGGASAFKDNCATCHGTGAAGFKGYPNLNDDDWLWGGSFHDIYTTLLYGVRSDHEDTHVSQMPAFGRDGLLERQQISDVADYVLALADGTAGKDHAGYDIFQESCASCHGMKGLGNYDLGSPNLADAIWLYGSSKQDVFETIYNSRGGVMPAWEKRLDDATIRQLTIYVHQLGGGQSQAEREAASERQYAMEEDEDVQDNDSAVDGDVAIENEAQDAVDQIEVESPMTE
jgi:cytochrome c oxidase cbb3-type subunit 3